MLRTGGQWPRDIFRYFRQTLVLMYLFVFRISSVSYGVLYAAGRSV